MTDAKPKDGEIILVAHNDSRFKEAAEIRRRVFVEEQKVPADMEWDPHDNIAAHLILYWGGKAAGTLRFYPDDGWLHVGRVAVLAEFRGKGLGKRLMERCLAEGRRLGFTRSFLNSQAHQAGFYAAFGYRRIGDEFMEAGIPHCRMEMEFGV